jgi:hypothetical protein
MFCEYLLFGGIGDVGRCRREREKACEERGVFEELKTRDDAVFLLVVPAGGAGNTGRQERLLTQSSGGRASKAG